MNLLPEPELKALNRSGEYPAFAYIMKVTTMDGYTWTKIGKTKYTPYERARGIKRDGRKKGNVKYYSVDPIYYIPCKSDSDAELMENVLRACLTLIDPRKFMPHDTFGAFNDDFVTYLITHPDVRRNAKEFGVAKWVAENVI